MSVKYAKNSLFINGKADTPKLIRFALYTICEAALYNSSKTFTVNYEGTEDIPASERLAQIELQMTYIPWAPDNIVIEEVSE